MNNYILGEMVVIRCFITDPQNDFAPTDPDTLAITIEDPNSGQVVDTYGQGGSNIVKDAVGRYKINQSANIAGDWIYYWQATGSKEAAGSGKFRVTDPFA